MSGRTKEYNLTQGHQVRVGCSVIPIVENRGLVMIQFDGGHPTTPYELTTPAGLWQDDMPHRAALREFSEELIVINTREGVVGLWELEGEVLQQDWVERYAKAKGLRVDYKLTIPVFLKTEVRAGQAACIPITFHFGEEYQIKGVVAFEPVTGSVEIGIPLLTELPVGIDLVDGEALPDGTFLDRPVIYYCFSPIAKAAAMLCGPHPSRAE